MTNYNPTFWGTVSWVELVWVLVNFYGFTLSVRNAIDARQDWRAARVLPAATPEDRHFARWMHILEWGFTAAQTINLGIGVWFSLLAPSPQSSLQGLIFSLLFILKASILAGLARMSRRVRKAYRAMSAERAGVAETRDAVRDAGRDAGRDPVRDRARDQTHDREIGETQ
jgi:hypothetical protein